MRGEELNERRSSQLYYLLIRILEIMISSNFKFGPNEHWCVLRGHKNVEKRLGYHLFKNATNWLNSYISYLEYLFLLQEL